MKGGDNVNQEYKMTIPKYKIIEIYNSEYLKGMSMVKLSKKYNVAPAYFSKWFKKLGLKPRTNKENSRRYNVNHNYFNSIDTEDKAYWLGFIYADGYIMARDNSRYVGIAISSTDYNHLVKFNNNINSTYPIHTYIQTSGYSNNSEYCRLIVTSDNMYNDLVKQGVVEHKTNILKPPQLDYSLIRHFIRGYFDGDGSIWSCLNKNQNIPTYSISFLGTDEMLLYIMNYLLENSLINREYKLNKRKETHIVSDFKFGGNQLVYKTLSHLYENSNVYLDRKYNKYLELKQLVSSRS